MIILKRKEYIWFLILIYTKLVMCNPCVNKTLNAIPYPNDCQAFILCWLSNAYLQTCPNGLFFDIKTNNCQPLIATLCCNMTLPVLLLPVPIFQDSTIPNNITNLWPFIFNQNKQMNHTTTTSLLPTSKPNSTLLTSTVPFESTTSIISRLWTESTDSRQTLSLSGFTINVTEERTSHIPLETITYTSETESTNSLEFNKTSESTTSASAITTDSNNQKSTSKLLISSSTPESTPIISTLWTELIETESSSSGVSLNVTNIKTTTPSDATTININETEITYSEESSQSNIYTTSTSLSSPKSNKKNIMSTSSTLTNLPESTLTTSTWWIELTDSSKISPPSRFTLNVTKQETITPFQVTNNNRYVTASTISEESTKTNIYTTRASISSTEPNNNSHLLTKSTSFTNVPSLITLNTESDPTVTFSFNNETEETVISTDEQHTNEINNIETSTLSSRSFPTITMNPLRTRSETLFESSTSLPTTILNLNTATNISYSPMISFTTEIEDPSTASLYSVNKNSTELVSIFTEFGQTYITNSTTSFSTEITANNAYTTQENSTPESSSQTKLVITTKVIPSTLSSSSPEFTDITDSSTSRMKSSSEILSTTPTDPFRSETRFFTRPSTFLPLFSTESPLFPTLTTTLEHKELNTITQYSVTETSTKSVSSYTDYLNLTETTVVPISSDFTEATKQGNFSITDTEYITSTVKSPLPSEFQTFTTNFMTISSKISSEYPFTVTADTIQTETRIFTETSTLLPIFSSTVEYESKSPPSQFTANTDNIKPSKTTVVLTSPSEITETTNHITGKTETSFISTAKSSPITFTNTIENRTWQPITFRTDNATNIPITTILSTSSSELDERISPEYTSSILSTQLSSKYGETSTTIEPWPTHYITTTEDILDRSAVTVMSSLPNGYTTMEPTTNTEYVKQSLVTKDIPTSPEVSTTNNSIYTSFKPATTNEISTRLFTTPTYFTPMSDSTSTSQVKISSSGTAVTEKEIIVATTGNTLETDIQPQTMTSTLSKETKSTHTSISKQTTTEAPIVTSTARTLPPLPYSPPPCVYATSQKSTKAEITLSPIPSIPPSSSSTNITPEPFTDRLVSKPVCKFWDNFAFPDENDCKHYHECYFGIIRKSSCRYGYEFNSYALKCMPQLEANCQRRRSTNRVLDFLYQIRKSKEGPLITSSPSEDPDLEYNETK